MNNKSFEARYYNSFGKILGPHEPRMEARWVHVEDYLSLEQEVERQRIAIREIGLMLNADDESSALERCAEAQDAVAVALHIPTREATDPASQDEIGRLRDLVQNLECDVTFWKNLAEKRQPKQETSKRAYYETHDPPHCPTCGCGLPSPDTCSCGRVELKDGYVRATCADGSVHTKGGCNSPTETSS